MIRRVLVLAGLLVAIAGLVGCARPQVQAVPASDAETQMSKAVSAHQAETEAISEGKFPVDSGTTTVAQTIKLVTSEWAFSPATITIPAGKTVRLVLENDGKIVHEVAVDDMKAKIEAVQDPEAMGTMDEDEMREMAENADKGVVHIHVAPGMSASEVFSVSKPGTYEFACEIPGHRELGMAGKLIVTQ